MIVVYHNPQSNHKCLEVLETSVHDHQIIKYQDKPLEADKLLKIINILKVNPIELIKTDHDIWKEKFQHLIDNGIEFSIDEFVNIMVEHPEIIIEPIVINGDKAIIGCQPDNIKEII